MGHGTREGFILRSRHQKVDPVSLGKPEGWLQQIKKNRLDSFSSEEINLLLLPRGAIDLRSLFDPCLGQRQTDIPATDDQD